MILIYDNDFRGHHFEFIKHLINHSKQKMVFFLHKELIKKVELYVANYPNVSTPLLIPIGDYSYHKTIVGRTISEMKDINNVVAEYNITKLVFMFVDPYQYVIGRQVINVPIIGIMFNPMIRISTRSVNLLQTISRNLRIFRKTMQVHWMLRAKNIESIFILNDKKGTDMLNIKFRTNVFKFLVDPVNSEKFYSNRTIPEVLIGEQNYKLLVVGSISFHKNLHNIIKSINEVKKDLNTPILLVVAGEYASAKDEESIKPILNSCDDFDIVRINRFVSDEELSILMRECQLVLMPYIDFFGSSGVLGHAASHKKLVLSPNVGIIADLVQQYKLGVICVPNDPADMACAISSLINRSNELLANAEFETFLEDRQPLNFVKTLLNE